MTGRERVMCTIAHHEPDRIPIDLGATPSSGISAIAYGRLKRHLGITSGATRVYDVVQQLAEPEEEILRRYHVDVRDVGRMFTQNDGYWQPVKLSDGSDAWWPKGFTYAENADGSRDAFLPNGSIAARMPAGGCFFDQTIFPYLDGYPDNFGALDTAMEQVPWSAFVHAPWDTAAMPDFYGKLREQALAMRAASDEAMMIVCGCNLFEWGTFLRRMDNFLMDLLECPETVEGLLDALMEKHMQTLEKVCKAVGDVVDIIRFGDDLGMDTGPFMSPATYRSLFKPRHAMLCGYVKKHSKMKTFLHSCGSIRALLPDLIEAGFDIINPVQTACQGMEPRRLKQDFGKDITFWGGGVDTRRILNQGKPEDVHRNVRENIDIFAPGGGFVFGAIHNILPDVPPENIEAMFRAVEG